MGNCCILVGFNTIYFMSAAYASAFHTCCITLRLRLPYKGQESSVLLTC